MQHDDNTPLHSAKRVIRRLRSATDRIARNALLSSIWFDDSNDVE